MKSCPVCTLPVVRTKPTGPVPTYCSQRCRLRAAYERAKADGRRDRWAAARKKRQDAERASRPWLPCKLCGDLFEPARNRRYCSRYCGERDKPACSRAACERPAMARGLCKSHWRQTYRPDYDHGDPERKRVRDLARAKKRRAVLRGAEAEDIDRELVGERDGWRCGICRRRVNRRLTYPHPMSQSLDHVIPLAEGGAHTYANVRISHLRCNVRRSDRGGNDQLAIC